MRAPSPPVVAVALLLTTVVGAVVAGSGATPVGTAAAQEANETDADAGALVAAGVDAGGESVGTPVAATDAAFGAAFYRSVSAVATSYNEEQPDIGLGGGFATGNVVNLHVTNADGEEAVVSFRLTEDNRITDLRAAPRDDATIRMATDRATFDRIANARSPGEAFARALDSGDIRISGIGLASSLVWAVVNLLRDVQDLL